ncbi:hypothetical protein niasHT_030101 [Heterodera trifolii]|uniref:E3 SUMO-protein ligase NSE2 n=1 Tax=Heterodera trifolii TaxID=157864 RepID=A0ABD2JG94_9BILA
MLNFVKLIVKDGFRPFRPLRSFSRPAVMPSKSNGGVFLLFPANVRWHSLEPAYARLFILCDTIGAVCDEFKIERICERDWRTVEMALEISDTFHKFVAKLEQHGQPTISLLFPGLNLLLRTFQQNFSAQMPSLIDAFSDQIRRSFSDVLLLVLFFFVLFGPPFPDEPVFERALQKWMEALIQRIKNTIHAPPPPSPIVPAPPAHQEEEDEQGEEMDGGDDLVEEEKYDINFVVSQKDAEISEITISVNDLRGKFVKPTLKKVSKYDNKFRKAALTEGESTAPKEDFRSKLKTVEKKNVMEELESKANIAAIRKKLDTALAEGTNGTAQNEGETEQRGEEEEEDMLMSENVLSAKDPITKRDIKEPVKNSNCGHIYDRQSVQAFIEECQQRRQLCQCPVQMCTNKKLLQMAQMVPCPDFFKMIRRQRRSMSRGAENANAENDQRNRTDK